MLPAFITPNVYGLFIALSGHHRNVHPSSNVLVYYV